MRPEEDIGPLLPISFANFGAEEFRSESMNPHRKLVAGIVCIRSGGIELDAR